MASVVVAGVVVAGVLVAGVWFEVDDAVEAVGIVRPWKAFAAVTARPPERAIAPATIQRVTDEMRSSSGVARHHGPAGGDLGPAVGVPARAARAHRP